MSSNEAGGSGVGPTILWSMLKGKKVITNDGKEIGGIKEISDNYIRLEKGTIKKDRFWIPKYVADAYDGKQLWLFITEEEVHTKHQYGEQPPTGGEDYTREFESFKTSQSGGKAEYKPESEQRIRIIENYKNIRDLK
jgi:hypothetical protein